MAKKHETKVEIYNPTTKDINNPPDPFLPSGKAVDVEANAAKELLRRYTFLIDQTDLPIKPTLTSDKVEDIERWKEKAEKKRQNVLLERDFPKKRGTVGHKIWNLTNHRVIGGIILAAVLAIAGVIWSLLRWLL